MSKSNKSKFKYVKSKHDSGCAVACIAMITGLDYDKIEKDFKNNFDKVGIPCTVARDYIADAGFSIIEKRPQGWNNVHKSNIRMLQPFADIHYVTIEQFINTKTNHAWVMLKNGTIYCPNIGKIENPLSILYSVINVIGCWKD